MSGLSLRDYFYWETVLTDSNRLETCSICKNVYVLDNGESFEQCLHCLRSCCYDCLRVGGGFDLLCDDCFEGCTDGV